MKSHLSSIKAGIEDVQKYKTMLAIPLTSFSFGK
jgi:hypothetical protein